MVTRPEVEKMIQEDPLVKVLQSVVENNTKALSSISNQLRALEVQQARTNERLDLLIQLEQKGRPRD